jgi:hypothetical protein
MAVALRRSVAAASLLVIAAATAGPLITRQTEAAQRPAPRVASIVRSSALEDFASRVQMLGESRYSSLFTGAVLSDTGRVDVYANPQTDAGLVAAVRALNTSRYPVTYLPAARSYSELVALNAKLTHHQAQLQAVGVQLSASAPDAETDSVLVTLAQPPRTDPAHRSPRGVTAGRGRVATLAHYASASAAVISSVVGPGYTVARQPQREVRSAGGRDDGVAPYAGGDYISVPLFFCTTGFAVVGNRSGRAFMLSAGHCGWRTWKTPAGTMGQTSSLYWRNAANDDFQTIRVAGAVGRVNGNTVQYTVKGQLVPAVGTKITYDGALTGEVSNDKVISNNATLYDVTMPERGKFTARHLVIATGANGLCKGGDSGGPVFQRARGNSVDAIGTIVAYYHLPGGALACAAERIGEEEFASGTHLLLGR